MDRHWNRTTPIHRLPTEILISILQLSVSTNEFDLGALAFGCTLLYPSTGYYVTLLRLCSVSAGWARMIRGTPSFWIYTSSIDSPKLTDLILERSRAMPLWVRYRVEVNHRHQDLYGYLQAVLPESHRWHTLVIDLYQDYDEYDLDTNLKHLNTSKFTQLSRLLVVDHGARELSLPNYFKLGRPPLKYIQACMLSLEWDSYQLSNLEVLCLCDIPESTAPSISQITDILKMSPSLSRLEISDTYISVPSQGNVTTPIPSLPVLDSLRFYNIQPSGAIRLLLSHVKLHNNSKLSITSDDDEPGRSHDLTETEEAILTYASKHLSSLPSCPATLYIGLADSLQFDYGDDVCSIYLGANEIQKSTKRIEQLVLSLSPEQRGKPTVLSLDLEESSRVCQLMYNLTASLNVTELTVDNAFNPMDYLNRPDPTTGEWVFPNVTRLALSLEGVDMAQAHSKPLESIFKLAEARSGLTRGAREVDKKAPVALESIELLGEGKIQMQDIERLEALVPDVRVLRPMKIIGRPPLPNTVHQ